MYEDWLVVCDFNIVKTLVDGLGIGMFDQASTDEFIQGYIKDLTNEMDVVGGLWCSIPNWTGQG